VGVGVHLMQLRYWRAMEGFGVWAVWANELALQGKIDRTVSV
jgi:hypothetical protein